MSDTFTQVVSRMRMINTLFQEDDDPALCCAACANFAGNLAWRADRMMGGHVFRAATIKYLREVADGLEIEITKELH